MDRLTTNALPIPAKFNQCQLCSNTDDDICAFRLWQECDEQDKPEPNNFLLVCQGRECQDKIDKHPRRYHQVAWGKGGPGHFLLLCGDCPFRSGFACTHTNLKSNGGPGLLVNFTSNLPSVHLSYSNGTGEFVNMNIVQSCEGHPTKKPITF